MTQTVRETSDLLTRLDDSAPAHSTNRQLIRDIVASFDVTRRREVNVADAPYFAVGGGADETAKFLLALSQNPGKKIVVPKPFDSNGVATYYYVTASLPIPSNTEFEGLGMGRVEFRAPAGAAFSVLDLDAVTSVRVRNLSITKAAGADATKHGVDVRGLSTDILIEDVWVTGFLRGLNVAGEDGTVPSRTNGVTLRRCKGIANTTFGLCFGDSDDWLAEDCEGLNNILDGAKVRKKTTMGTFRRGIYRGNGANYPTGGSAGDGIDSYAGGESIVFDDVIASSNYGNGITWKSDLLTRDDPTNYGYVRRAQFKHCRCYLNNGSGATAYVNSQTDLTLPLPYEVTMTGGSYFLNNNYGVYIACRGVTLQGVNASLNRLRGFFIDQRAINWDLLGCNAYANGYPNLASGFNLYIAGRHGRVIGGSFYGVDSELITQESDYATLPVYSAYNIYVDGATAQYVTVDVKDHGYASNARDITVSTGSNPPGIVFHLSGTGIPVGASGQRGGPGTTWLWEDATLPGDRWWKKYEGSASDATVGWRREGEWDSIKDRTNADATLSVLSERRQRLKVATTAIRTITLPSSSLYAGLQFRFWRTTASTGGFGWNIGGLTTLAAGEWCDVEYDGTGWGVSARGNGIP